MAASTPKWEAFALNCANGTFRKKAFVANAEPDQTVEVVWPFFVLIAPDSAGVGRRIVLVDTGVQDGCLAARRRLIDHIPTSTLLAQLGVEPDQVQDVILTLLHWDHVDGLSLFKKARVWISGRELSWARALVAEKGEFFGLRPRDLQVLSEVEGEGRLCVLSTKGQAEGNVAPGTSYGLVHQGVELMAAPGHTPGLVTVQADCVNGRLVLASDAAYLYQNLEGGIPIGTAASPECGIRTLEWLRNQKSRHISIIPGHDPRLFLHTAARVVALQ